MNCSVIIFSYNNPVGLRKSLDSLLNQIVLPNEIYIIDNSKEFNSEVNEIDNSIIHYVYNGHENAKYSFSVARNKGLALLTGEFIILAEDDAYYAPTFIQAINKQFKLGTDIICYRILPNPEFKDPNWIKVENSGKVDFDFGLIDLGEIEKNITSKVIFNSFAFRKEHYLKCRGWGADCLLDQYFYYNSGGENTLRDNLIIAGAKKFTYEPNALMIHDKRETRLNNRYFFNRYTYWGAEEAYNFLRRNEIKRTFLFLVIKNLISIIFKLKKQQITQDSFEKRELLILIKRFSYYTIIFHFILFKKYRDIMKENWDRDWKSFDYTKMKELNLLWFLNYKLYLNGKNYI